MADQDDRQVETHPDLQDPEWRKHAQTDVWLSGKELDERMRKPLLSRNVRRAGLIALVLLVVLVASAVVVQQAGDGINETPALEANTAPAPVVDPARPFAGTPAESWAEGLTGLTVPQGEAINGFSAEQVTAGYDQVRKAITAAAFDPHTLYEHDGAALLALLAPSERERLTPVLKRGAPTLEQGSYLVLLGPTRLLPSSPRLTGSLTARAGEDGEGELLIHASYTVAYAFEAPDPAKLSGPTDIVSFVRQEQDYHVRTAPPYKKADAGLGFGEGGGHLSFMDCAAAKNGLLAPQYLNTTPALGPGADRNDPSLYDPAKPLPTGDNCT